MQEPVPGRMLSRAITPLDYKRWNKEWICFGVLLLLWIIVWLPRLKGPIDLRWDASTYYVLGTALAEGKGYRLLNEPGQIEAVQYPPLLPLIVAAHQRLLGSSDYLKVGPALRLFYFVISGVYLLASYELARKLLPAAYALGVAAVTALSFYSFLHPSDTLYAEMPFALVSVLFLLVPRSGNRPGSEIASGVLAAAAYLLRTAGIALLAAWIAESILRREFRKAALRLAVSAIPILAWQLYIWRVTASSEYQHPRYAYQRAPYYYSNVTYAQNSSLADPFKPELGHVSFGGLTTRVLNNLAVVPLELGESALIPLSYWPTFAKKIHKSIGLPASQLWRRLTAHAFSGYLIIVGLLALAGAALVAIDRERRLLSLYFGLTLGAITLTPWQGQFWRYLAPLTPLTLTFAAVTLFRFRRGLTQRYTPSHRVSGLLLVPVPFVAILLLQIAAAVPLLRSMLPVTYYSAAGRERNLQLFAYGADWHALDPTFEWIRRHATPGSIIATTVPQLAYIRSDLPAVLPPFEPDPAAANQLLAQVPVRYLVVDDFGVPGISERYAAPVVSRQMSDWRLVFTAPDDKTRVYERVR